MALVLQVRENLRAAPVAVLPLREMIDRADCEHGARYCLPEPLRAEIDRLWDQGETVPGIAALVGASETATRDHLQRAGRHEPRRPAHYGRVREVLAAHGPELIAAHGAGGIVSHLAAEAGIHPATLRRYLVGEGVTITPGPRGRVRRLTA